MVYRAGQQMITAKFPFAKSPNRQSIFSMLIKDGWMKNYLTIFIMGLFLILNWNGMAASAQTPQIWLDSLDPISRHTKFPDTTSDYMDMFQPNAPWNRAAADMKVFELGPKFVMEASDGMLAQIFADLKRRNIGVAIGASWLPGSDACGKGVEGFTHSGTAESVANRIHRLGGDVEYVVMDEPLYFGHKYNPAMDASLPIRHTPASGLFPGGCAMDRSLAAATGGT
jgi:hypothetical protein